MFTKTERRIIDLLLEMAEPTCQTLAEAFYDGVQVPPAKPKLHIRVAICKLRKKLSEKDIILERNKANKHIYRIDKPELLRELICT